MLPKILLVDDIEMFLDLVRVYLRHCSATILSARNGRETLKLARSERPNLIFMDLHMPVITAPTAAGPSGQAAHPGGPRSC